MALSARLELRQGQSLVITPQLQQAIKLLQLSNLELEAFVEGELERNPLLQRDEADPDAPEERRGEREDTTGDAGEAEITLRCGVADQNWLAPLTDELRFLFISGDVEVVADDGIQDIAVLAAKTAKAKCVRCWHHRADVGADPTHPELCGRCVGNVEGPGEERRWF